VLVFLIVDSFILFSKRYLVVLVAGMRVFQQDASILSVIACSLLTSICWWLKKDDKCAVWKRKSGQGDVDPELQAVARFTMCYFLLCVVWSTDAGPWNHYMWQSTVLLLGVTGWLGVATKAAEFSTDRPIRPGGRLPAQPTWLWGPRAVSVAWCEKP